MNEVMQVEVEAGRMAKNAMSEIVARLVRVRGTPCADLRVFALATDGALKPTRAGLCLAREKLPELRKLVDALVAASAERPRATKVRGSRRRA